MRKKIEEGRSGAGGRLMEEVAHVLNECIRELGTRISKGHVVPRKAYVSVIGYGGNFVGSVLSDAFPENEPASIAELMDNPLRIEERAHKGRDDDGTEYEYTSRVPIWVEPRTRGGTPMCEALQVARRIAERWICCDHQQCFPPMVVNITDGEANDGDASVDARLLRELHTDDGEVLLFNCHLSPTSAEDVRFPAGQHELPDDPLAPILFEMSSELPDKMRSLAVDLLPEGDRVKHGARGFVFNGDISGIMQMIEFATAPAVKSAPV